MSRLIKDLFFFFFLIWTLSLNVKRVGGGVPFRIEKISECLRGDIYRPLLYLECLHSFKTLSGG